MVNIGYGVTDFSANPRNQAKCARLGISELINRALQYGEEGYLINTGPFHRLALSL